jgi:hypothetical protein
MTHNNGRQSLEVWASLMAVTTSYMIEATHVATDSHDAERGKCQEGSCGQRDVINEPTSASNRRLHVQDTFMLLGTSYRI